MNKCTNFLSFVSYTSLYIVVMPTADREYSTVKDCFQQFVTTHECYRMRMDNGPELVLLNVSNDFPGIVWEYTQTYDPAQNGLVERYHRVIMSKTRTLLHANQMNFRMWDDAARHAALLWNHTAHRVLDWKTPAQIEGEPPLKLKFILPFGQPVFVYIPKQLRVKSSTTIAEMIGIYMGYDDNGFRIWTPLRGEHVSRDVRPIYDSWINIARNQPHLFAKCKKYLHVVDKPVHVGHPPIPHDAAASDDDLTLTEVIQQRRNGGNNASPEDDDDDDNHIIAKLEATAAKEAITSFSKVFIVVC